MELYRELEPTIWAIISGVDEDKITLGTATEEENKRVDRAIEIAKEMKLFMEDEENYDNTYLWNTCEKYKDDYNIVAVALDYIELTPALIAEYTQLTKGMSAREDMVLLNLSASTKNLAKKLDLTFFAFTQTTDGARYEGRRDQGAVKGGKSIPNKADAGITVFEPTQKELDKVEALIEKVCGLNKKIYPNIVSTIYKNRGGKVKKAKIWQSQNLGNVNTIDLFCTNMEYEPISVEKIITDFLED